MKDIPIPILVLVYFASFIFLLVANTYSYLTQGNMAADFKGKRGSGDHLRTAFFIAFLLCGLCPGILFIGLPSSVGASYVVVNGVRTSGRALAVGEGVFIGLMAAFSSYWLAWGISFGIYHLRNFVRGKKGRLWIVLGAAFLFVVLFIRSCVVRSM